MTKKNQYPATNKILEQLNLISDLHNKIQNALENNKKFKLGNFIILKKLGGGNYGQVYLSLHSVSQKKFAVKIIDKFEIFKQKDDYVRGILKKLLVSQGILMQMCRSQHVVKCYQFIENQRYKIFILQYCNNQSMDDQLKKRKAYPLNYALTIFKQIIIGLSELHRNNIIHRDLKTQNILIHNGIYKIADFGFSKKLQDQHKIGQFTCLGTRTTMAPQVINRQKYGVKADIWSLGIIFFTMICSNVDYITYDIYKRQSNTARSDQINRQIKYGIQINFQTVEGPADKQTKKFISQMLKLKQQERISWKQLINHKIFDRCNQGLLLNPILNSKIYPLQKDFIIVEDKYIEDHQIQLIDEAKLQKLKQQQNVKNSKKKKKNQKQLKIEQIIRKQMNQTLYVQVIELKQNYKLMNFSQIQKDFDQKCYEKIQRNNLQCLKAIYIYENIILQLENNQMLDLKSRTHNQLLFLLINRCNTNVNWAEDHLKQFSDDQMFVNYYEQILYLKKKINKKWSEIEQRLYKISNKLINKLIDFKNKIFHSQQMEELQIYFAGIQNIDYDREKQVQYTQNKYFANILSQLKGQPKIVEEISKRLKCYKKINQIKLEDLEYMSVFDKIKQILKKYD